MFTHVMQYVKMPPALLVLGVMYALYACVHIVTFLREGYWSYVTSSLLKLIIIYYQRVILLIVTVVLLVKFVDLPVTNLANRLYNEHVYRVFDFINAMGEGWFVGGLIFTAFLLFAFYDKTKTAIACKIALMSSLYAGLINTLAKFIFNRQRPGMGLNPDGFFHFFLSSPKDWNDLFYACNSMPSGHTITIFAAITPLILYTKSTRLKIILISCGILMGVARIYTINHWVSDVFLSTILGIIIGRVVYQSNHYRFFAIKV